MKLTRIFLLKAFEEDYKQFDNNAPANSLKKLIITNSNIDIILTFFLSFLYIITIGFINNDFYEKYPTNFITIAKFIFLLSFIFIIIELFRVTIITWEKYIRSLNKPQESSERSSINSNKSNNSRNNSNSSIKKKIEMNDIDEMKNPFLSKEDKVNEENNENNKYNFNENIKNLINNNNSKKSYIDNYYESKLLSPLTTIYDKLFIKLYIYLINKLNKYLSQNESEINEHQNKLFLYIIIIKYPHTLSTIFHILKQILFFLSFCLSFCFWVLYLPNKINLKQYSFNIVNIFLAECLSLYCLFRLCYFSIKFIFSIFICPVYMGSLYLGYFEDKINEKLNELINTRIYTDKSCLVSRNSINKFNKEEILNTCSICLENFIKGDVISTLPCSKRHTFHSYCLEEWFHSNILCPLCRYDFSREFQMLIPNQNNINLENIMNVEGAQNNNNDFFNINDDLNLNNLNLNDNNLNNIYNNNINNNEMENNNAQIPFQNIEMNILNQNQNNNNNEHNNNNNNNI